MGVLSIAWAGPAPEKSINLRVADFYPPGHPIEQLFKKHFMTAVQERSKGRITFDYYGNGALLKAPDIPQGIMAGITDMGNSIESYKIWPISSFQYLPGAFTDQDVAKFARASWPIYRKYIGRLAEPQGMKYLLAGFTTNYQIAGRGTPKKVAELGGAKIRSAGSVLPHCIKALGGTPVSMPSTDAYDAMEKGVLDGISLAIPSYRSYQFQELLKWVIINADLGSAVISYGINFQKFNSLPPDLQKVLIEIGNDASIAITQGFYDVLEKELTDWKAKGIEMVTWSAKEKDKESLLLKPVWSKWISEQAKRYPVIRQLLTEWSDILTKEGIPLSQHYKDAIKG